MFDYIELGPTPYGEDCAQVGSDDYSSKIKVETKRYVEQLEKRFPQLGEAHCTLRVKGFPHDFGTYHEVCIVYNEDDAIAVNFAYFVDSNLPEFWNDDKVLTCDLYAYKETEGQAGP